MTEQTGSAPPPPPAPDNIHTYLQVVDDPLVVGHVALDRPDVLDDMRLDLLGPIGVLERAWSSGRTRGWRFGLCGKIARKSVRISRDQELFR